MRIKNIVPKPIGIGNYIIMPGETKDIPNDVAYVNEYDKDGKKTGRKIILPAIVLLDGLGQIAYVEDVVKNEEVEKVIEVENDEVVETYDIQQNMDGIDIEDRVLAGLRLLNKYLNLSPAASASIE